MTNINLQQSLGQVLSLLDESTNDSGFLSRMTTVFSPEKVSHLTSDGFMSAFNTLPVIEILASEGLNGAFGAFSASNGIIYLSESVLQNQGLTISVLLEEMGHYLDDYYGGEDTSGDEGELFSNVVRGVNLGESELTRIQSENDYDFINLGGNFLSVEQSDPITLIVNTTVDENDGSATLGVGLSLRDAVPEFLTS